MPVILVLVVVTALYLGRLRATLTRSADAQERIAASLEQLVRADAQRDADLDRS